MIFEFVMLRSAELSEKSTPEFNFEYLIQFEAQTCGFLHCLAGHEVFYSPSPPYYACLTKAVQLVQWCHLKKVQYVIL